MKIVRAPYPHKYTAIFDDGTRTSFGHQDYEDYTQHHDRARREAYRDRHAVDLRTGDPRRAGFLSYYILWGDSTSLRKNLEEYKKRFKL